MSGNPTGGRQPLGGERDGLTELDTRQLRALEQLLAGATDGEAADAAGVSRQTVSAWKLHNPAFRAELNRQRAELWDGSQDRLRSMVPRALDVISDALEGEDAAKVAVQLLRLAGLSGAQVGEIGPTTPQGVVDEEIRRRHDPARLMRYLPPELSGIPITDEDREAVRLDMARREREALRGVVGDALRGGEAKTSEP